MNLFEISAEIRSVIENHIDVETGEMSDEGWEELSLLEMAKEEKCLNIAKLIKSMTVEADAIKQAAKDLTQRAKSVENRAENLKKYLSTFAKGESYKDHEIVISWRKSESVSVVEGVELPEEYETVKTTVTPNKTALKAALKAGEEINGVTLEKNQNIQIK